jgi:hypothetical protein
MSNYNYAIEKYLAERGGEADKDITRTCGNCESYDAEHWQCLCADEEEGTFHKKKDDGCYYHRTHAENERLKMLVKQRQDETNRLRLEEQRRNGTGECEGCPFREMHEEMYAMLKKCLTDLACSTFYNRYEEMKELMRKLNNKEQQ